MFAIYTQAGEFVAGEFDSYAEAAAYRRLLKDETMRIVRY